MTEEAKTPEDINALPFEQALQELESIVSKLEQGRVDLEQSIQIYERGEALKKHCEKLLSQAEKKIEKIRLSADGSPLGASETKLD
ncbi:MAG: exodeoxyribonuclease VII small subunit [Hyphomicrobiales bacterium]